MPELTPNLTKPSDAADVTSETKPSRSAKAKVLLFLAAVIAAECAAAYWMLPSRSETSAMAEVAVGIQAEADDYAVDETEEAGALIDQVEVDLEEFSVTAFQPVSSTTLRIDFHLWGTVRNDDYNDFLGVMDENRNRFREQVLVTVRSADITDLTDAQLGLIRRKILEKTNRILGGTYLRTVIFSDFSFIEQ
ncbi:MAG TPA: hypothetical protein VMY42_10090 [Thermoguttaceae bacterium]|nr:hypothetical protein [Thermoguttaceae bacterium]